LDRRPALRLRDRTDRGGAPRASAGTSGSRGACSGSVHGDRLATHRHTIALPFCKTSFDAPKPKPTGYPKSLKTLGDQ
jgi:hypothetical protein